MPRAYSYARWSDPKQGRGDSRRRQDDPAVRYCEKHKLDLDESFVDPGISAYRGKNRHEGALGNFIKQIDAGTITAGAYLLVEALDRLSRQQVLIALELFTGIIRRGIKIVTLTNELVFDADSLNANPALLMMSIVEMMRAHEESRLKGERVAAANANKRRRAREDRTPITALCPGWLKLVDGGFVVIAERAEVVREIYLYAIAGLGKRRIVERLNRALKQGRGVSASRGHWWSQSSVAKILANEAVLGIFQPHRKMDGRRVPEGPPIPGYFPAIIDEATFWQAQEAIKSRRTGAAGRKGPGEPNLFSGLGRCVCGASLRYIDKGPKPKGGQYLVCSDALRNVCENHAHFPYEVLEHKVLNLDGPALRVLAPEQMPRSNSATMRVAELDAQLARKRQARQRFMDEFGEEEDDSMLAGQIRKLGAEIKEIEAALVDARKLAKIDQHADRRGYVERVREMGRLLESADSEERLLARSRLAQEFRRIIESIILRPDRTMEVHLMDNSPWEVDQFDFEATGKTLSVLLSDTAGWSLRIDGKLLDVAAAPFGWLADRRLDQMVEDGSTATEAEFNAALHPRSEQADILRSIWSMGDLRQIGPQAFEVVLVSP
jgi:DNA invertase Pin-like site-specific DNA recombinase